MVLTVTYGCLSPRHRFQARFENQEWLQISKRNYYRRMPYNISALLKRLTGGVFHPELIAGTIPPVHYELSKMRRNSLKPCLGLLTCSVGLDDFSFLPRICVVLYLPDLCCMDICWGDLPCGESFHWINILWNENAPSGHLVCLNLVASRWWFWSVDCSFHA